MLNSDESWIRRRGE